MVAGKFDIPDAALSPAFVILSMVSLGLIDSKFLGFDFAGTVITFGAKSGQATAISLAMVGSLAILGFAYYTNQQTVGDFERIELWIVTATVALILAPPFFPAISSILNSTAAGIVALIVQSGGYYSLSFTG